MNVVVEQTRTELAQDRKRRASEIEESQKLNQQLHSLEDANEHLEKRVHVEHEHAVHEQQLAYQVQELQEQLAEAGQWRQKALEQAEKLNGMVSKLQKEQKMLKGLVGKGDKNELKMNEKVSSLEAHIQSLDNDKVRLAQEISIKETLIEELQEKLDEEASRLHNIAVAGKKDLAAKDKNISGLNSKIVEFEK